MVSAEGVFLPPALDADAFFAGVEACRERYPNLAILSGVELGEPHWFPSEAAALLGQGRFDRVLGSLHCVRIDGDAQYVDHLYRTLSAPEVVRGYLTEALNLVESTLPFTVLAHIDYPIRNWPADGGPYDPAAFEDEHRSVLKALAASGRALELNTRMPLHPEVVRWFAEAGGEALTFGSDAHQPADLAAGFRMAADVAGAQGFERRGAPGEPWTRTRSH